MNKVKRIVICGMVVAISFVLDYFSVTLPLIKISLYALPLIINGILFGPVYGLIAGIVEGFLVQLKYGISLTTPLWMLAPILWGVLSAYAYRMFKSLKKNLRIVLSVVLTCICITAVNTIVILLDGLIIELPVELSLASVAGRFGTSVLASVLYSIVLVIIVPPLQRFVYKK